MPDDPLSRCRWPSLAAPFAAGLREAVAFVFAETIPLGIIATGTIVRGQSHASSDLDIVVFHDAPFRRRIQRYFNGVPTEILVNPPEKVRSYFVEEHREGRLITAHMVATGVVVYEADPVVEELRAESRDWLARPITVLPEQMVRERYIAATRLEDGADVSATDGPTAAMFLTQAVIAMLEFSLRARGERLPRSKELLATIAAHDPDLGRLAASFFTAITPAQRLGAAETIGDRTIGVRGFFEWDSGPEPVTAPITPASAPGKV
jgi:hypothetical protein